METIGIWIEDLPAPFHPVLQALRPSSPADGVALILFLLSSFACLTRGRLWQKPNPFHHIYFERPQLQNGTTNSRAASTRNIAERLEKHKNELVIFWGSQSGTSERFAETLGRECSTRFGLRALIADLSDYDAGSIASISHSRFAVFLLSTYGEGDPSDNTTGLWDWVKRLDSDKVSLAGLRYIALGLGNSKYKYYNHVLDVITSAFDAAGATALLPRARCDDASGGTEEDFQAWKEDVFAMLRSMGHEERSAEYQPSFEVQFTDDPGLVDSAGAGHKGSVHYQPSSTCSAIVSLPVKSSKDLFTAGDRNCVHLELDLAGSPDVHYKTGDHIGVWPVNPAEEIDRLLDALGLQEKRNEVVTVAALRDNTKPKVSSPTTLESIFRYDLDICGPVSRQVFLELARFAPCTEAKTMLLEVGRDREKYAQLTSKTHITFARLLQLASPSLNWPNLPLSFVIETLLPLQPRYYSISSSSVISPRCAAITALVVNKHLPGPPAATVHGLTSNYLFSASNLTARSLIAPPTFNQTSRDPGLGRSSIRAHIRKSKFKLPITSSTPLILICAGTGFAPFRAFLAERLKLATIGKPIGKMLVFFGCRHPDTDYIYRDELEHAKERLYDKLELYTAFSRESEEKVYVQDRVAQHAARVLELLDAGASMYICGKASMAREVDMRIEAAVKVAKGLEEAEMKAWTDALKKRGKWKADVWG
ncbi:cytochrome P450 reductase 2 [Polyplosphaeria fusca]|uniref:NADPH--cytochrome P450 reductase n=1 Tax=Polyplosphaeria fusca TaxID=682080 RepID=A0A9P4R6X4_9PLEO|nr:cytochrome P450 reductase 2 [Polyplosphaeria fusca]